MTAYDELIKARALIDTPEKWVKKVSYKIDGGRCASAAISSASGHSGKVTDGFFALARAISSYSENPIQTIVNFNDNPATTHADIMAAFDRAIEAEKPLTIPAEWDKVPVYG